MSTTREHLWTNAAIMVVVLGGATLAQAYEFAGGTGAPNDPYQIATAEDLIAIGADDELLDKHFVLVNDIDLDPNLPGGRVFDDAVIASDESESVSDHRGSSFDGVLDGRDHTIANLHIEGQYGYDAGLFGKLSGLVKDLHFTNVVVSGSPCGAIAGLHHCGLILRCTVSGRISGADDVGGLVGANWDGSLVECQANVRVSAETNVGGMAGGGPGGTLVRCQVQAEVTGDLDVGGLVGDGHDGQIIECRAAGTVVGGDNVGGLTGEADEVTILRCSAHCDVTATRTAGGLAGGMRWSAGPLMANCYAQGSVAGAIVGGLVGRTGRAQIIMNCYAACYIVPLGSDASPAVVGGLIGEICQPRRLPITVGCFWDAELSGVDVSTGQGPADLATGLTTEQMQDNDPYREAGWDLSNVWTQPGGNEYLMLQWEPRPPGLGPRRR